MKFRYASLAIVFLIIVTSCNIANEPTPLEVHRDSTAPNIVIIMTDDQPPDTMDFMPTLRDELMANGINFTNTFTTTPACCPSRASILTGQYAHNHGIKINRQLRLDPEAFDDSSTIATWLQSAGYRTSFLGKYLNDYNHLTPYGYIPPGWDDWQVFIEGSSPKRYFLDYTLNENGNLVQYGTADEDYSTDVLAGKAVDFIYEARNKPFFLFLSVYAPHQPRAFAERHRDLFRTDEEISPRIPPNFNEEDMSDKPAWARDLEPAGLDRQFDIYQDAVRSLMAVDDAIADILEALDTIGQKENTLIIFLSDNGIAWGEHRLENSKNCPYEECIRIPFVVYYPNVITEPRIDESLILNIDIAPTLAQLADIEIPESVNGLGIMPILDGSGEEWRTAVLIEHWPMLEGFGSEIPYFEAIRTQEWKYVKYDTGELELYDLVNDPYEMNNLAYVEGYEAVMEELDLRLEELLQE